MKQITTTNSLNGIFGMLSQSMFNNKKSIPSIYGITYTNAIDSAIRMYLDLRLSVLLPRV